MTNILHITYDLRDRFGREKTKAVKNLIDQTTRIADVNIIDLVRVPFFNEEMIKKSSDGHIEINSLGLPYGIFLIGQLKRAYKNILKAEEQGKIDLKSATHIHAHKLTFEGYIGWMLSKKFKKPLFITLRQTDFMVMRRRPDLRSRYKNILADSERIFYLVPFMLKQLEEVYSSDFLQNVIKPKSVYLPNIVEYKKVSVEAENNGGGALLTILRMTKESVRRKNLRNLLLAVKELDEKEGRLDIIGKGDYQSEVEKWIEELDLCNKVKLLGAVDNSKIYSYYLKSKAFVMPSRSESFGMVYAEALQTGTPILYSKGVLGFDGIFDNVGCAVDPFSVESIKEGIKNIIANNDKYRETIAALKKQKAFDIFTADYAYNTYKEVLERKR